MGFFGSFFGNDQAKDLANANKKANSAIDSGYNDQQGYYDKAASNYDPYKESGAAGQQMYTDLLGLNGTGARDTAQGVVTSDPLWTGQLGQDQNAALRSVNARGLGGSGAALLAGQRVLAQNYGSVLDRYMGVGQQGQQAAAGQAGIYAGQGDNAFGYGATKAGNAINYGNAQAANRNTGINNILGTINAAAGVYRAATGAPTGK